jgi:hypothetical protein
MMVRHFRQILVSALSLITICGSSYSRAGETSNPLELRVLLGSEEVCLLNPPAHGPESALALAAPVVAAAAESTLNAGMEALSDYLAQQIGQESSAVSSLVRSAYLYELKKAGPESWEAKPALSCIAIALGSPDAMPTAASNNQNSKEGNTPSEKPATSNDPLKRLGFNGPPDLYIELALQRDALSTAFHLQVRFVQLKRTSVRLSPAGSIGVNLVVAFSEPDANGPFAILPLSLPVLYPDKRNDVVALSYSDPWGVLPKPPDTRTFSQNALRTLSSIRASPVNVSVTVEETGTANKFMLLASHLVGAGKTKLPQSIGDTVKRTIESHSK